MAGKPRSGSGVGLCKALGLVADLLSGSFSGSLPCGQVTGIVGKIFPVMIFTLINFALRNS